MYNSYIYNYDWSMIKRLLWTFRAVTTMTGQWLYDFCEHFGPLQLWLVNDYTTSVNISGRYNYDWSMIIRLLWTSRAVINLYIYNFQHFSHLFTKPVTHVAWNQSNVRCMYYVLEKWTNNWIAILCRTRNTCWSFNPAAVGFSGDGLPYIPMDQPGNNF